MKLIIFCAYFYPHEGGVERYVYELFRNLSIDCTIVTANTERAKSYEEWNGFKIYRLPCRHILGRTYPIIKRKGFEVIDRLGKEHFDYVITQTRFFNTTYIGARFAGRNNIPLIHFEHGTEHVPLGNPLYKLFAKLYDHTFGFYIFAKADKLVGISEASERLIKHIYSARTYLIRNSIYIKNFVKSSASQQSKVRKSLGLNKQKIIAYVGRLIPGKGVQDLLYATRGMENVVVLIIGDGNFRNRLRRIGKNAVFLGQRNQDEIIKCLSIADIFVNPSYAEGLPTSVLEAGALGLPIIATDVGGTNEIVTNGVSGFLIKPHDVNDLRFKITALLQDKKMRDKFSKNIRMKVKDFDWGLRGSN